MSKPKAVQVDLLADLPLDIPGAFLRLERRYWPDGTSCLHIAKWGRQPETGRPAPWWPLQYVQVPWGLGAMLAKALIAAVRDGRRERAG